jgi:dethiobiotin synthase
MPPSNHDPRDPGTQQRPSRVVAVVGTGTEVGKTWVSVRLLEWLRREGHCVAARKPAQSFDPADAPDSLDASLLAAASGEDAASVCPPHRWYETAMAPPMAADVLGRPSFTIQELVGEIAWPARCSLGLVETAGGVRSPLAVDGDCAAFCAALRPDLVVLVADAGLGTINAVRLTMTALVAPAVVALNRFDPSNDLHRRNRAWLSDQDGFEVFAVPGEEADLGRRLLGSVA